MATLNLDITKDHCPMTFVKTKIELAKLQTGDTLHVLVSEGEPLKIIPKTAHDLGFSVVNISEGSQQGTHTIAIVKQ